MARIRHIAIATQDPEATARFYIDGLDLNVTGESRCFAEFLLSFAEGSA